MSALDVASKPGIASTACQELGLGGTNTILPVVEDPAAFGTPATGKWLNVSSCKGAEVMVQDCQCAYPYIYGPSGKVYALIDQCSSGSVVLLPRNTTGMEAGQLAITCPTTAGACTCAHACKLAPLVACFLGKPTDIMSTPAALPVPCGSGCLHRPAQQPLLLELRWQRSCFLLHGRRGNRMHGETTNSSMPVEQLCRLTNL